MPEPWKVTGEGSDSSTLLLINHGPVVLALLFVPLLRLGEKTERFVPVRLQRVCDQAVRGVDRR